MLADSAIEGSITLAALVVFAQSAVGTPANAFGGLNWALDFSSSPVDAVLRLGPAMATAGALAQGTRTAAGLPARDVRFRNLTFAYPNGSPVLDGLDLTSLRARRSRSSVRTAQARRRWRSCSAGCMTRNRARSKSTAWTSATSIWSPGARASLQSFKISFASSFRFGTMSRRQVHRTGSSTIAHHERPDFLDRLSMLRHQVFVLDHMYMSLFTTCGWILRLVVTMALLTSIHPALFLLVVFARPTVLASTWRPAVERSAWLAGAELSRLSRHLFTTGTTAPPGKEVRVARFGPRFVRECRAAWQR